MNSTQANGSSNSLNDKYRLGEFGENRNRSKVQQPVRSGELAGELQSLFPPLPQVSYPSRAAEKRAFEEATRSIRAPIRTMEFYANLPSTLKNIERGLAIHAGHLAQPTSSKETLVRGRITGPVAYLKLLLKEWRLKDIDAAPLLGFERDQTSEAIAILNGIRTLAGHDAKDRIRALFNINALLGDIFRDDDSKNQWLRRHHDSLEETPLKLMLSGSMEKLLVVRDFAKYTAGI